MGVGRGETLERSYVSGKLDMKQMCHAEAPEEEKVMNMGHCW
jgi:hypothetical protein